MVDGRDDLYIEYITLINMCGDHEKAYQCIMGRKFHPWEGGEGKITTQYTIALLEMAKKALEGQGRSEEATECYQTATVGTDEPAGAMYYNDQPADMILYQGLAFLKLGKVREARSRFYRLIDYGEQHLEDQVKIEYFAVSLPEFLIFDEDYTARNRVHCYYLMALGNIGLGDREKADAYIKEATTIEPSHMMCRIYSVQYK